jgi:hypothetical protein
MSTPVEKIVAEALSLGPEARAFVAERLLESLDAVTGAELSPAGARSSASDARRSTTRRSSCAMPQRCSHERTPPSPLPDPDLPVRRPVPGQTRGQVIAVMHLHREPGYWAKRRDEGR